MLLRPKIFIQIYYQYLKMKVEIEKLKALYMIFDGSQPSLFNMNLGVFIF